ncbi:MAG TPA: tetratricopeptide repeat protein [Candidatus Hydrogenedens sp.]|nr:tetratricopeptide repeat protein [Candidatus Hydrogenedens sp.]
MNGEEKNKEINPQTSPENTVNSSASNQEKGADEVLDQSFIDSLFQNAKQESSTSPTDTQPTEIPPDLAQKVVTPPKKQDNEVSLLSQDEIEELIELARKEDKERQKKKQEILEQITSKGMAQPTIKPVSKKKIDLKKFFIPIAISLFLGLISGTWTYIYLMKNRIIPSEEIPPTYTKDLATAKEYAKILLDDKQYLNAIYVLERALKNNPQDSPDKADAQFLLIKAKYLSGRISPGTKEFQKLIDDMETVTKENPNHPMAPYVFLWKGKLHEADNFPYPAIEAYERIVQSYPQFEERDEALFALNRLELQMNNTVKSAQWGQQLIKEFPSSSYALEARFNLAEVYRLTGLLEDARTLYIRIADTAPDTEIGARAILRISEMAYKQGRYEQALIQLETKLNHIRQFQYNDEAYLLLAKTYKELGRLEEAKTALQDLLVFFPDSKVHPYAWVELSQIYYSLGDKEKAFQTANEASLLYPNHPDVLANKADFLALQGNSYASAIAYLEAEKNGGTNPSYLLKAGQLLMINSQLEEAIKAFEELKERYYGTKEALKGTIERAKCLYKLGKFSSAVSLLEDLKKLTPPTETEYKSILQELSAMYLELGLKEASAEIAKEWFQKADNPDEKIESALILINNDNTDMVYSNLSSIDLSSVNREKAAKFLYSLSQKLLTKLPSEGLALLEQVYYQYPESRTSDISYHLLETYINTERTTSARRVIQDWENELDTQKESIPDFIDGEILWGNYMFEKQEWESALQAYNTAIQISQKNEEPLQGKRFHTDWAKYQSANILAQKSLLEDAIKILDELIQSNSSLTSLAQVKAEQIKLEMIARK